MTPKPRVALGWIVGLLTFAAGVIATQRLGDAVGVASEVFLDEPVTITHGSGKGSWDEETDVLMTWFGQTSAGLTVALAIWAGFSAGYGSLNAGWDRKGWLTFRAWAVALVVLLVASIVLDHVLPDTGRRATQVVRKLVTYGATIGVAVISYRWWKWRTKALATVEAKSDPSNL